MNDYERIDVDPPSRKNKWQQCETEQLHEIAVRRMKETNITITGYTSRLPRELVIMILEKLEQITMVQKIYQKRSKT